MESKVVGPELAREVLERKSKTQKAKSLSFIKLFDNILGSKISRYEEKVEKNLKFGKDATTSKSKEKVEINGHSNLHSFHIQAESTIQESKLDRKVKASDQFKAENLKLSVLDIASKNGQELEDSYKTTAGKLEKNPKADFFVVVEKNNPEDKKQKDKVERNINIDNFVNYKKRNIAEEITPKLENKHGLDTQSLNPASKENIFKSVFLTKEERQSRHKIEEKPVEIKQGQNGFVSISEEFRELSMDKPIFRVDKDMDSLGRVSKQNGESAYQQVVALERSYQGEGQRDLSFQQQQNFPNYESSQNENPNLTPKFNLNFTFLDTKINLQVHTGNLLLYINTDQTLSPEMIQQIQKILTDTGYQNHNIIVKDKSKVSKTYDSKSEYKKPYGFSISA